MKLLLSAKSLFLVFLAILSIDSAQAQTITINTPMDFGRFVIVDNAAPRIITLMAGGGFSADPQYIFFVNPQMGNVTVNGYPPATPLTVTVGTTTLNPICAGTANFVTSATFTDPGVIVTDGGGSVTFDVGAVLSSDGGGVTHTDCGYNNMFTVMVAP